MNQNGLATDKSSVTPGALWRLPRVCQETGLQKSTIYKLMAEGKFIQSVKIGDRCVAWSQKSIETWIAQRIASAGGAA